MHKTRLASFGLAILVPYLGLTSAIAGCSDETNPPVDPPAPPPELSAELRADLQASLDQAVAAGSAPGAVLHVTGEDGTWSGAAGIADLEGDVPMAPGDRFRAGSMLKTMVAAAVLQSVEAGALDLDDRLTDHLPADVTARIQHADAVDVGMLLGHRTGIPDWITPNVRQMVVDEPTHVWSLDEILDEVEPQAPLFEPGEEFAYSNTNYVLLGEILAAVEGRSWREVVRERVMAPAGMDDTTLPDPGDAECPGCAHGYVPMDSGTLDTTIVDPSMAGASGGHALITTAADLSRMFERLQAGALFEQPETLDAMFAFQPADDGGEAGGYLVGYGFAMMKLDVEGETVLGHMGGTAGYTGFNFYLPSTGRYVSGYINTMGDPSPVLLPVVERLAQP